MYPCCFIEGYEPPVANVKEGYVRNLQGDNNIMGDGTENGGNWYSDKDFFETLPEGTIKGYVPETVKKVVSLWPRKFEMNVPTGRWVPNIVKRDPSNIVKITKRETLTRPLRGLPRMGTRNVVHYPIKLPAKYNDKATYWVPGEDLYPNPDKQNVDVLNTTFYWYPPFTLNPMEQGNRCSYTQHCTRTTYLLSYFYDGAAKEWISMEGFAGTIGEDDSRLMFRGIIPYVRNWVYSN